jgi:hypothetical protein
MPQIHSRVFFRVCLLTASISLSLSPAAFADVFAPTAAVLPSDGAYVVPDTCVSVLCIKDIQLSNFDTFSDMISGGDELTQSNVTLTADLYQNLGSVAGPFITSLMMTGQIDITYFSKPSFDATGDFNTQITSLDLGGSFTGLSGMHTLDAALDSSNPSTGMTSVDQISSGPDLFQISSFFDVFAELSLDGGAFMSGPERVVSLVETPEPGYYLPFVAFACIALHRLRRPKRPAPRSSVS